MPTVVNDMQRKYRYKVMITPNASGVPLQDIVVDEFTPPDKRFEPVTRQNQALGPIVLVGPPSYGEMTLRLALRVTDSVANDTATVIATLQNLNLSDADTCDVLLSTLADAAGSEQVAYKHSYENCKVTGYRMEGLNRRGDDDMLHIELTMMPSRVRVVQGEQMGG